MISQNKLRLGAQSVTLLSTLRDPTQLRRHPCAFRKQPLLFVPMKAKNSNSYCSSEGRNRLNPKKYSYPAKKVSYGLEHFVRVFGKLTTPSGMFLKQKTQILIAHQKEEIDRTQKSTAIRQKKFGQGLEDFVRDFCC